MTWLLLLLIAALTVAWIEFQHWAWERVDRWLDRRAERKADQ